MATEKEFKLIGSFQDNITAKLKKLNSEISAISKSFTKMQSRLRPIARDMGTIAMASERVAGALKSQRGAYEQNISAMKMYRGEMGKTVSAANKLSKIKPPKPMPAPRGGGGGRGGKGGGVGDIAMGSFIGGGALLATSKAAQVITNTARSAFGFLGDRFKEAMEDELSDIQAQGAIFGVLRKEGITSDYSEGKKIAKALDIQIAKMVASSPIPTETITTLNRTLSDTFLPGLMKGFKKEGANNIEAAQKSAQQLAGFYEQIGYLTPPNYPIGMVTKGITKLIESGKITGELAQIDFFQMNPQLIPTLKAKNFEQQKTIMDRMKVLQEAMSVVMPPEAMAEIRTSLSAASQGIQDNLTNVSVGLFSFGAEMKSKVVSYVYRDMKTGQILTAFKTITTPFQLISTKLAPVMSEFGNLLSQMSNKIGPLTVHLAEAFAKFFGPALQDLTKNFAGIADSISKGDLTNVGSILGQVVGNILKALTQGLDSIGSAEGPMGDFMREFTQSLNSVFPPEAQQRLAKKLEEAFSTLLSKIVEFAAPPLAALLVSTIKSFVLGLFSAGPTGLAILGALTVKFAGLERTVGALQTAFQFLVKFNPANFAGLLTVLQVGLTTIVAPVAAIAGAIMGLIAIFRHMDFILSSTIEALKLMSNGFQFVIASLKEGLFRFLSTLPGIGGMFKGAAEKAAAEKALLAAKAQANVAKIADNTAKSWKRTQEDAAKIRQMMGMEKASAAKPAAAKPAAAKPAATSQGGGGGGGWWSGLASGFTAALSSAWNGIVTFIQSLPQRLLFAIGLFIGNIEVAWSNLVTFVMSLPGRITAAFAMIGAAFNNFVAFVMSLPGRVGAAFSNFIASASTWGTSIQTALSNIGSGIVAWAAGLPGRVLGMLGGAAQQIAAGRNAAKSGKVAASFMGTGAETGLMSFGSALQAEQRGMPAGAKPIIANSSELIIPTENALNGNGSVADIIAPLQGIHQQLQTTHATTNSNFTNLTNVSRQQVTAIQSVRAETAATNGKLAALQSQQVQTNAKLAELKAKMNAPIGSMAGVGMAGGPGYGSKGSAIAGQLGNFIKATGGAPGSIHEHPQHGGVKYKHAPGSYHYAGRAIDIGAYANEQGGVLKRVAAFNAQYGVRPVELLHAGNDPNHQDHVHVAYARGIGMPRPFNSFMDALSYERHMMPAGTKAVYNTGETGGASPTVNVTVNGGNGDPNAIANQVAAAVLNAIRQAESSTIV